MVVRGRPIVASTLAVAIASYAVPFTAHAEAPADAGASEEAFGARASSPVAQHDTHAEELATTIAEELGLGGGSGSVSPTGDFTYALPLDVLPGIQGVQPDLGVSVSAHAGPGLLGVGGSLSGLPAIVRIPWAANEDGELVPRESRFDGQDTYAFSAGGYGPAVPRSGRLVPVPGGAATYHTAVESWRQYRAYGECGISGEPCTWSAKDGLGNTWFFGSNDSSQLWQREAGLGASKGIVAWGLSHVQDVHGNTYRVEYLEDDFMLYPDRIEYGCQFPVNPGPPNEQELPEGTPPPPTIWWDPNEDPEAYEHVPAESWLGTPWEHFVPATASSPSSSITLGQGQLTPPNEPPCQGVRWVQFDYIDERPDPAPAPVRMDRLLGQVSMGAEEVDVRAYRFEYFNSSHGHARLETIRRIGDDFRDENTDPTELPPIQIEWTEGTPGPHKDEAVFHPWALGVSEAVTETHVADINGDGYDDLVRVAQNPDNRVLQYALGGPPVGGEGFVALAPVDVSVPAPNPSKRFWHSLIADVDGNGADDVVMWMAAEGKVGLDVVHADATGATPALSFTPYPHLGKIHSELLEPGQASELSPDDGQDYFRLLPGDYNGDQIADLALVNIVGGATELDAGDESPYPRAALIGGSRDGLVAPEILMGVRYAGLTVPVEPSVADFDGDGLADIMLSFSRSSGIRHNLFRGHASLGLADVYAFAWANGDSGYQLFQPIVGDLNGDAQDDLLLAWAGPMNSQGDVYARDVRSILGGDFEWTGNLPNGVPIVPGTRHVIDGTAVLPGVDRSPPTHLAGWRHLGGDFNGDGFTDMVSTYSGVGGDRVMYLVTAPNGFMAPTMTPRTPCSEFGTCPAMPDGTANEHRWSYTVLDTDEDGRDDLVNYYSGPLGTFVRVALGSPTGLADFQSVFADTNLKTTKASSIDDHHIAAGVSAMMADLDGDAQRELIIATPEGILTVGNGESPDAGPAVADLPSVIHNGYGGSIEVDYRPLAYFPDAIAPKAVGSDHTDCGDPADCGIARRHSRPLVREVRRHDGRELERRTRYDYANGRYFPGPLLDPGTNPGEHPRADLSFARFERTDLDTQTTVTEHYHHKRPLQRNVRLRETHADVMIGTATVRYLKERESFEYQVFDTAHGTRDIRLFGSASTTYERGGLHTDYAQSFTYDAFGETASSVSCVGDQCTGTTIVYAPRETSPDRWIIRRVAEKKVRPVESGGPSPHVISWTAFDYNTDDELVAERVLLCDDAEDCECFDDAEVCVNAGTGRWLDVRQGMDYDLFGNLETVTDALGRTTEFTYDPQFATFVATTTRDVTVPIVPGGDYEGEIDIQSLGEEDSEFVVSAFYDDHARLYATTDLNKQPTMISYDPLGRPRRETRADGGVTETQYLEFGNLTQQRVVTTTTIDAGGAATWSERRFDGHGEAYETRRPGDGGTIVQTRRARMLGNGMELELSQPYYESGGPQSALFQRVRHDTVGRPLWVDRIRGAGTTSEVDLGRERDYLYAADKAGIAVNRADVDEDGTLLGYFPSWTYLHHDRRGHVEQIETPLTLTDYEYDDADRVAEATGPYDKSAPPTGSQYSMRDYDSLGRIVRTVDSVGGETTLGYDDAGNVVSSTMADGRLTLRTYDVLDRMVTRADDDGVDHYLYDIGTNARGRLYMVSGPWGTDSVGPEGYDEVGRPQGRQVGLTGLPGLHAESYSYDQLGRLVSRTMPDGTQIELEHATGGAVQTVFVDSQVMLDSGDFDAQERPGWRSTAAAETMYWYSPDGPLSQMLTTNAGGEVIMAYEYSHDALGNVRSIADVRPDYGASTYVGILGTDDSWDYDYDSESRLVLAQNVGAQWDYEYDGTGNLLRQGAMWMEHSGNVMEGWHNTNPQCLNVMPTDPGCAPTVVQDFYTERDARGNVYYKSTPQGSWRYSFDARDRIFSVTLDYAAVATFDHDATGRRTRKTSYTASGDITTYYPLPGYEIRHNSAAAADYVVTRHIDAPGVGRIATITSDPLQGAPTEVDVMAATSLLLVGDTSGGLAPGIWYLHGDHLGSTSVVTDASGEVVTRYLREPYGANLPTSVGHDTVTTQYNGHAHDDDTGLYDFGARTYDPQMGRFLSADRTAVGTPFLPGGMFNPKGLNRYAHAYGNPVRFIDPDGHAPGDVIHKVKSGDTLSGISKRYLGDMKKWPQVWKENGDTITNPHWIRPGMRVKIPGARARTPSEAPAPDPEPGTTGTSTTAPPSSDPAPAPTPGDVEAKKAELRRLDGMIDRYRSRPILYQAGPLGFAAPGSVAEWGMQKGADAMTVIAGETPDNIALLPLSMGRIAVGTLVATNIMAYSIYFDKALALPKKLLEMPIYEMTGGPDRQMYDSAMKSRAVLRQQLEGQ